MTSDDLRKSPIVKSNIFYSLLAERRGTLHGMQNEHLKSAAANLSRAVSDFRINQKTVENDINIKKHDTAQTLTAIDAQIKQLQQTKIRENTGTPEKVAIDAQINNLQQDKSRIQKESDQLIATLQNNIRNIGTQVSELENLANHLNAMA